MSYEEAEALECPACRAQPGEQCRYVEGAEHNGWQHIARLTPTPSSEIARLGGVA